jgi:prolyl-tRNA synthetase
MNKTAITPTRQEDYPQWYQQVIIAAELAENSPVRGCMVIKPWGYALWEGIQGYLDKKFKKTGHVNAYFPLLIPLSYLESEAEHVDGFAKECAVVTHHRLIDNGNGGLKPDGELEEPLIIRPTSETIIGAMYSQWVQSYRDLPILINQWANVMRWEMRTRLFLRTSEFLWQEGHTAHANEAEAREETMKILDLYDNFAKEYLAMPVIKGEKPCFERFPGAVNTYTIEAMMQDCKALQAGTSHYLGQNFAKASKIQFTDKNGVLNYAHTTSWGVSTRLIGGLIMTHSDDDGLNLPPSIAPYQIVIIPIYKTDDEQMLVKSYIDKLVSDLESKTFQKSELRIHVDDKDMNNGAKKWHWIKKGVPLRLEIGPRDILSQQLMLSIRSYENHKEQFFRDDFVKNVEELLQQIQDNMYKKALSFRDSHMFVINSLQEFNEFFNQDANQDKGFAIANAIDSNEIEEYLKPLKVTARCIIFEENINSINSCIFTGKTGAKKMLFAKSY